MPDSATAPPKTASAAQPASAPVTSQATELPPGQYDLLLNLLDYN